MRKAQLKDILENKYHYSSEDLAGRSKEELQSILDDIEDTSSMHPNESFEDFMEHEDND